ncbi:dentin sialophosphoprotein-like [Oncorhynchus nerka]|uniref:dentin sialophosphoprotein-like n=1 Tax=Oncorhynchus nerka TaxID=8023 RepID=UPI0011310DCA|nr:dentin sialophosphoprotein-like [Oncorhynchus nerka]
MKAAIVFALLFATVLCRPVKRSSSSSSESSEEVVKPAPVLRKALVDLTQVASVQNVGAGTASDESSDEDETEGADPTSDPTVDSTSSTDSADSDESKDSTGSTDSDDTEESESGEADTTAAPPTAEPTVEPTLAPTEAPIYDDGRGDSMGYPGDYKKSIYVDTNNIEKGPSPYKYYGKMNEGMYAGKKVSVYDTGLGNEIEKTLTVFKALQVHDLMEEDTSTPEVESQGLDVSSGTAEEPSLRQVHVDEASQDTGPSESPESQGAESLEEEEAESASASASDVTSESTSSASSDGTSESTSASDETDSSNSSEEATATPGAADSDESQESDSNSAEEAATEATIDTDAPVVIVA